jgi:hypothetical protein
MTAAQQKVRIKIPKGYSPENRRAISKDIIDHIKQRTKGGVGIRRFTGGRFRRYNFPGYTKDYAEKKGQTNVDLILENKMLKDIKPLKDTHQSVTIGHNKGTQQNEKAEGNQIGSYGQPRGNRKKARRYLGITKKELQQILKKYPRRKSGG